MGWAPQVRTLNRFNKLSGPVQTQKRALQGLDAKSIPARPGTEIHTAGPGAGRMGRATVGGRETIRSSCNRTIVDSLKPYLDASEVTR